MEVSAAELKADARRAGQSRWVEWLGRLGLAAKGVSYAIVAVLAIKVALLGEGNTEDRPGALRTLSDEPFGRSLLIALAAGFAAYALWRFVQAFLDRDHEGNDIKGLGKRAGFLARGLIYAGLCATTVSVLLGDEGRGNEEDRATAGILEAPAGRWLVIGIGAAVLGAGLYNAYRGVTRKFEEKLRLHDLGPAARRAVVTVGVLGHLARAVVFSIVGWFLSGARLRPEGRGRPRRRAREARAAAVRARAAVRRRRGHPRLRPLCSAGEPLPSSLRAF